MKSSSSCGNLGFGKWRARHTLRGFLCEVRYCLPGVGIGVEFVQIPPEAVRAIEEEVRFAGRSLVQKF